jgi:hypothetical protein
LSRFAPSAYAAGLHTPRHLVKPRPPEWHESARHAAAGRVSGSAIQARQAVVAEECPRLRAAIEHALRGEGYRVLDGEPAVGSKEPVVLLVGAGDGLHVLEASDVAGALSDLCESSGSLRGEGSPALGIHAFVPRPYGAADVLRVARTVCGFDRRRRTPEP